jgi:mannose-6-phosphate isomerase
MNDGPSRPVLVSHNRVPDVYEGGSRIDAFRGSEPTGLDGPEDWIGSLMRASDGLRASLGLPDLGLSEIEDGHTLRELATADPIAWLGRDSVDDPTLLVKLLDAGERLPVHFHPTTEFAREHLGRRHGKTEAWLIVEADPGAAVWLGFRREVNHQHLTELIAAQDEAGLLQVLNRIEVAPGDVFFVPAGTPHSIGAGMMLVEIQQASSLSILLEHRRYGVDGAAAALGLGWDTALQSIDTEAQSVARGSRLRPVARPRDGNGAVVDLLAPEADGLFRLQRARRDATLTLSASHGVLIVIAGEGTVANANGSTAVTAGQTWFVAHAAAPLEVSGSLDVVFLHGGIEL